MGKPTRKHTVEEIKDRFKAYESYYSALKGEQKKDDDYYELVFEANVPNKYETRMPSTARDWVDVGVRHFTLDNPKPKVPPRNDSAAAKEQVEILEVLYALFLNTYIREIKRAARKLLKRGELLLKVGMDDTYFGIDTSGMSKSEMKELEEKRLFHFPLHMSVPDPINVYPSPAHNGLVPVDVFESFSITAAEAENMCRENNWSWKTNKSPHKSVKWVSYYSADWRYFSLDDIPVLPEEIQPNILGFCPYVHIDAGFGDESYEGKPEYLYRSLLFPKRDMLRMEVRNLSQVDAINARFAWPRHKATLSDVAAQNELKQLYPGGVVPTDPEEWLYEIKDRAEIGTMQGEQPPSGLYQQFAMIQSMAMPPQVLSGTRPSGVFSGQHQETLIATAKPIYKDAFKNLEDGLGVLMGMGARILERVYKHPVKIKNFASEGGNFRTISPSDINGHYACEVRLLAEPPEANDMKKGLGKALRQGGSISLQTELKQYHDMSEKETMDEMAQILAERLLNEPALLLPLAKDAMDRLGMHKEREAIEQAEEGMIRPIPPNQRGEESIGREMAPRQGRMSPEMESMPTPGEREV